MPGSRWIRTPSASTCPAAFKLKEKAEESFDLFRSGRRIGTARVEEKGAWSARFTAGGREWKARATSADDLLKLIGTFILAHEARKSPAAPTAKPIDLGQVRATPAERKLSRKWAELSEKSRLRQLDATIAECRKRIAPA